MVPDGQVRHRRSFSLSDLPVYIQHVELITWNPNKDGWACPEGTQEPPYFDLKGY